MGLTRAEAFQVLDLEDGASDKEIRDRFKQLALKWHPDKNPDNPEEAEEKFQKLSAAYNKLTKAETDSDENEDDVITLAELLIELFGRRHFSYDPTPHLFCDCFHCRMEESTQASGWRQQRMSEMGAERRGPIFNEETAEKLYGDHLVNRFADKLYNNFNQPKRSNKKIKGDRNSKDKRSSEEASRNAQQLLEAEDKAKREREKKREKNKRKKEAKKKRKTTQSTPSIATPKDEPPDSGQEDIEEDEFDVTSAFIARASKKKTSTSAQKPHPPKPRPHPSGGIPKPNKETVSSASIHSNESTPPPHHSPPHQHKPPPASLPEPTQTSQVEPVETDLAQSRNLASLGNRAAKDGHFGEAVRRYTEAISLYPYDHRYFGNRSFCYDYLHDYTNALADANRALDIDIRWPKGYYRQGRAYAGLSRLEEAENSFVLALRYDPHYKDAIDELFKIRVQQLMGMGFSSDVCELAVREFGTVQASIDAILAGKVIVPSEPPVSSGHMDPPVSREHVRYPPSDPQRQEAASSTSTKEKYKVPPRMLRVNNAASRAPPPPVERPSASGDDRSLWVGNITSDEITEDMLTEVFVKCGDLTSVRLLPARRCAFINYKESRSAAQALKKLQGYHVGGCYLLLRYPEAGNKSPHMVNTKKPGPVNGTECHYWRTTGCHFGTKCRWEHIPGNKGVDLSPMM